MNTTVPTCPLLKFSLIKSFQSIEVSASFLFFFIFFSSLFFSFAILFNFSLDYLDFFIFFLYSFKQFQPYKMFYFSYIRVGKPERNQLQFGLPSLAGLDSLYRIVLGTYPSLECFVWG